LKMSKLTSRGSETLDKVPSWEFKQKMFVGQMGNSVETTRAQHFAIGARKQSAWQSSSFKPEMIRASARGSFSNTFPICGTSIHMSGKFVSRSQTRSTELAGCGVYLHWPVRML
jgi:hypothetical protein